MLTAPAAKKDFNLPSRDYYGVTSAVQAGFSVYLESVSNSSVDCNFQLDAAGFGPEHP